MNEQADPCVPGTQLSAECGMCGTAGLTTGVSLDGGDDAAPNGASMIPAGGTLIVYVGMSYAYASNPAFMLNVRLEALE